MNKGRYIFSQITDFIYRNEFNKCVKKYQGNYRIRDFSCFDHFLCLMFGQLSHQESLRGIILCLQTQKNSLYHLGFSSRNIYRSTLADANEKRDWRIYRDFAQILIQKASKLYINDTEFQLDLKGAFYAIDSTTIELCLNLFPWAKLKTVRAGVKMNLQLDLRGNIPKFFDIVNAREHDVNFLDRIEIESEAHYVFDRGYLDFERLYRIHKAGASFVLRLRDNIAFKRIYSNKLSSQDKEKGLRCDQIIKLTGNKTKEKYPENFRRIKFFDKVNNQYYNFATNDFSSSALIIANIYRNRWQIELFFKWIKQHLKIKSFWGYSENAVKTQICSALCSYLIVAIVKKTLKIELSLYEILQILVATILTKDSLIKLFSSNYLQNISDRSLKQLSLWDC